MICHLGGGGYGGGAWGVVYGLPVSKSKLNPSNQMDMDNPLATGEEYIVFWTWIRQSCLRWDMDTFAALLALCDGRSPVDSPHDG